MNKYALSLLILLCGNIANAQWVVVQPIKPVTRAGSIGDIVSHLNNVSTYYDADIVTFAHEATHGTNGEFRQRYGNRRNCLYVLSNNMAVITEPPTTLSSVARKVAPSLRGNGYQLYMVSQGQYWENEPLYILDEWTAYSNGAIVGLENNIGDRTQQSFGSSLEFFGYALTLLQTLNGSNYDSAPLKGFITWNGARTTTTYLKMKAAGLITDKHKRFYGTMQSSQDTASLRSFCIQCFGPSWAKENLGVK